MEKRVEKDELIPRMRTIFKVPNEERVLKAIEKHNDKVKKGEWLPDKALK
jgi:hypothetical protein